MKLQNTIEKYNKETKELTEILKSMQDDFIKQNDYTEFDLKIYKECLEELNQHYNIVKAFCDGYTMATGGATQFTYITTLKNIIPDLPLPQNIINDIIEDKKVSLQKAEELTREYNKSYLSDFGIINYCDNAITSIVEII